jgi:hypothetical protein
MSRAWTCGAGFTLAALCCAGTALGQDPARVTARPDQRVQLDFQHYYTVRELEVALNSLASAYPEYLRLESIGESPGGHEIWMMTVTRLAGADPVEKPGLFIGAGLGRGDLCGTEMALFTILELVQNHGRDPLVERVLEDAVLYVAICLDPDLRDEVFAEEGADPAPKGSTGELDANFEIGWQPDSDRSGPYPLSQPEADSVARFLLAHPNVAVLQTYAGVVQDGVPVGLASVPAADAALYGQVVDAAREAQREDRALHALSRVRKGGGSLLEFGYGHRGAFGFVTVVAGAGDPSELPEVFELFPLGRRAYQSTLRLARALPRLVLREPTVTRLKGDLWQIDVVVSNVGTLPTLSTLGQERFACGSPQLATSGAKLVAAAVRTSRSGPYDVATPEDETLRLDHVAGGASSTVRLVVTAAAGSSLELALDSPRAGGARTTVTLE